MIQSILDETLITLEEAADNFCGIKLPLPTVKRYVAVGYKGLKLEAVKINRRYTSQEAIRRFIERKRTIDSSTVPLGPQVSQEYVDAGLRRHGIIE